MVVDTFYTLTPINWVLRFFVLSNVRRKQNKIVKCWSLTENLIVLAVMLVVNIFFLINKIQRFEGYIRKETLRFTDTLQLTYLFGYAVYIVDLIFVYRMKDTAIKYLRFYSNIDKILGVPNFSQMRARNLLAITILIVTYIISSSLDFVSWLIVTGWVLPTLYSLDYIYNFINALTLMDVTSNVVQIEFRLKVMIGLIENCYSSSLSVSGAEVVDESWMLGEIEVDNMRVDRLKTVSYNKCFGILSLCKYYVLLLEQVTYINTAFGIRLVAFCLNLLTNLIYLTNIIIRETLGILIECTNPLIAYHVPAFTTFLRIINYASVLLILIYHCQETYKLSDNIVRMIDLTVISKKIPNDLKTSLTELRALIVTRPIRFHGASFFTLDYPLLVSIVSVVVTYTIILLQSIQ